MKVGTSWGVGRGLNGREAGREAIQQAFTRMGTGRPSLAIAFISQEFEAEEVQTGLSGYLGGIPTWGFSTVSPISISGEEQNSVVVAVISIRDVQAQVKIISPSQAVDAGDTLPGWLNDPSINGLLLAADGVQGLPSAIGELIKSKKFVLGGVLASGGYHSGSTYQLGENRLTAGSLSLLELKNGFKLGIGMESGWSESGLHFQITQSKGYSIQTLDGLPAVNAYSNTFGFPVEEWFSPPLKELIRLYSLGIELFPGSKDLAIRTPIKVGLDGSFIMNASVAEGQTAHLLLGDCDRCHRAAQKASEIALYSLGQARPLLALAFIDLAWRYLFNGKLDSVLNAIQSVIGPTPVIGAYTLGQIKAPSLGAGAQIYNQAIQIALIGQSD